MKAFGQAATLMLSLLFHATPEQQGVARPRELYQASLHTFSLLRSGTAVDDPATGVHHAAAHTQDAFLGGTGLHPDLSGGWYNAADYGKWTMMAAITVSYMLDLYQFQQQSSRASHQPDPKLLAEAQWGLRWLLKMQDADGGVRQKVDGATQASLSAAWGNPPEFDPNRRIAAPASTGSTADFAAVMYQAARLFAETNPTQSRGFRLAADRAWEWMAKHPNVPAHDPFYPDHDPAGELLWAQSEHALTHKVGLGELAREVAARPQAEVSWQDPSLLGVFQLASARGTPVYLREAARQSIMRQAYRLAQTAALHPFHVVLDDRDYVWGSAERVLGCAALFLMADSLQPAPLLHKAALDQLAWMLGNNALHHSFITGFGQSPVLHP